MFESIASPQARLRLAEELEFRRETLAGLRRAQVDGGTDNLVAAIAYLDYSLLNRGDQQKAAERALEHNRVGNAHYKADRFREAIGCYEEAIKEKPNPVHFSNLAGAWEFMPDLERMAALDHAIATLRRGLKIFPDSSELREALKVAERNKQIAALGGDAPHTMSFAMLPAVTPIAIEFADNLAVLFEEPDDSIAPAFAQRLASIRDRIKEDMEVDVPGVRIRKNDTDLPPGTYILMLDEIPLVSGNLALDKVLTLVPRTRLSELGIRFEDTVNPADGAPASWVSRADAAHLPDAPWDAIEYIVRHLNSLLRKNLAMFTGLQEVIDKLEQTWSTAGRQIASNQALTERFTRMAQALLDEFVPIAPLESLCDAYLVTSDKGMDELLSVVRALPEFNPKLPGNENGATLFEFDPDVERKIEEGLVPMGDEFVLTLLPEYTQEVLTAVRNAVSPPSEDPRREAIVVREPKVRRYVRKLVELEFPQLFALSLSELTDAAKRVSRIPIMLD